MIYEILLRIQYRFLIYFLSPKEKYYEKLCKTLQKYDKLYIISNIVYMQTLSVLLFFCYINNRNLRTFGK